MTKGGSSDIKEWIDRSCAGSQRAIQEGQHPVRSVRCGGVRRRPRASDGRHRRAVAATVAAWEQAHGLPVHDWPAIGREERGEEPGGVADVSSLLRQVQPAIARHTEAYAKLVEVAQTLD